MTRLLRIDSSSRREGSHSREIGDHIEMLWRRANPTGTVRRRDVADGSIPFISQPTIDGFYTAPEAMTPPLRTATALSDRLIAELQEAETLLVTAPIYNFGPPAALKAWIDLIVRMGHTFAYEDGNFRGLTRTRRAIVVCAYGAEGYLDGQPFAAANFLQPYLSFLFSFLGIEEVRFVSVQATTADDRTVARHKAEALHAASEALAA